MSIQNQENVECKVQNKNYGLKYLLSMVTLLRGGPVVIVLTH